MSSLASADSEAAMFVSGVPRSLLTSSFMIVMTELSSHCDRGDETACNSSFNNKFGEIGRENYS